jgi:hypothetical protein
MKAVFPKLEPTDASCLNMVNVVIYYMIFGIFLAFKNLLCKNIGKCLTLKLFQIIF